MMQTIGGFLALLYFAVLAWLGYANYPWWWILPAAFLGLFLYLTFWPQRGDRRERQYQTPALNYLVHCAVAAIPFGLGRLAQLVL